MKRPTSGRRCRPCPARAVRRRSARRAVVRATVTRMQRQLVALMGEVACAEADAARYVASKFERVTAEDVALLDTELAALEARGLRFDGWATPGANPGAAALDVARTAARRAERRLTALAGQGRHLRPDVRRFINRLSDLLWLLAREAEQ